MLARDLRKSILQAAIQGNLVEQHDYEGDAFGLLEDIKIEREQLIKEKKLKKAKTLSPILEDEIPFDIPDSWCWARLGDILEVNSRPNSSPHNISPDTWVLEMEDIEKNTSKIVNKVLNKTRKVSSTKNTFKKNDVLYGKLRPYLNKVVIPTEDGVCSSEILPLQVHLLVNEYVKLYLMSSYFLYYANSLTNGTRMPRLGTENLRNAIIPIPPLAEQRRIVSKVEEVMKEIDEYEIIEKEAQSLKQDFPGNLKKSLLKAAVEGKLTEQHDSDSNVDALINAINSQRERLIKENIIKKTKALEPITEEEIPFDIPDNWRWIRFGDLVDFKIGKTPPRKEPVHWNGDYSWVSIADMIGDGYIKQTKESISQHGFENSFNGVFSPKGTLLMSFKLTVGKVSILDIDAIHNEAIISIFPYLNTDNIMRNYLFKTLPFLSKFGDSKGAIKGDTLNSTSLNNLLIPLPPLEEQKRIVKKLEQLLPLCDELL